MTKHILVVCTLLSVLYGCLQTVSIGTLSLTKRTFDANHNLVCLTHIVSMKVPSDLPDFTTFADPVWFYEDDLLRMAAFPLEPGELNQAVGGYYVVVWAEEGAQRVIAIEGITQTGPRRYWIYDGNGVPHKVTRTDFQAVVKHWSELERGKQEAKEGSKGL